MVLLQARVLAAVTPTSQTPLQQARDSDGSLLITTASRHELPSGSHSVLKICPGYLKYGWSSDPQQYATLPLHSPKSSTPSSRMLAARAALSSAIPEQGDALPSRVSQNSVQTSGPSFAGMLSCHTVDAHYKHALWGTSNLRECLSCTPDVSSVLAC